MGFAASGNVEDGQALGFGLPFSNPGDQPGHVVDVDELDLLSRYFWP